MRPAPRLTPAHALAIAVPALLLAGAWGAQLFGGLVACEMCLWQRWPLYLALVLATVAVIARGARQPLVAAAGLAILVSGLIGAFHAGVEWDWWDGLTRCATGSASIADIMRAPLTRCDEAPWRLFGISLAGYNALISTATGIAVLWRSRSAR